MTSKYGLHLKTSILILIMVSVAPLGDTFLGKGMKSIPPMASWAPADVFRFFFAAFTSGTIWIGIGLPLTFFIAWHGSPLRRCHRLRLRESDSG